MTARLCFASVVALALLAVFMAAPVSAAPVVFFKFDETTPFLAFNPCNGDDIAGDLEIRGQIRADENPAGGGHADILETLHGTGVSTDGTPYLANEAIAAEDGATFTNDQFELNIVINLELVSLGSAPNVVAQSREHITIDANGDVAVEFVSGPTIVCHGG